MADIQEPKKENQKNEYIELLIDKKIADAKVMIAEARLKFTLSIGALFLIIFGFIYPIFVSQQNEKKVDAAIEKMEDKFELLAGQALKKPEMEIYYNDVPSTNKVIEITSDNNMFFAISKLYIQNIGNKIADPIFIKFYLSEKIMKTSNSWSLGESSYEDYPGLISYTNLISNPTERDSINIKVRLHSEYKHKKPIRGKLVILYGSEKPAECYFNIKMKNKE